MIINEKAFIFALCIKMGDKTEDCMFYINFTDNLINLQIMTRTEEKKTRKRANRSNIRNADETDTNLFAALNTERLFLENEL